MPVRGKQVVLIPDQQSERLDFSKSVTSDPNGKFSFDGLTPGVYKLFAWESIEPNSWHDRGILSRYESHGVSIQIPESGHQRNLGCAKGYSYKMTSEGDTSSDIVTGSVLGFFDDHSDI
jgi:hypothetical protein